MKNIFHPFRFSAFSAIYVHFFALKLDNAILQSKKCNLMLISGDLSMLTAKITGH